MSTNTSIEWTEKTWNPVAGCDKVSQGCKFCYAESIAHRYAGSKAFPNGFAVTLHPERLKQPLSWRQPQMIFVNSMSDLFHEAIPASYIRQVWDIMEQTPRHTYQILTKRATRMADLCTILPVLPNVWLGVSIENRRTTDRLVSLLKTPAVVRFVSAEPLLDGWPDELADHVGPGDIQWLILGGESGPKARECHPTWIERGIKAARTVGAAPFVKQMGSLWAKNAGLKCYKGNDLAELPEVLRVREWPTPRTLEAFSV